MLLFCVVFVPFGWLMLLIPFSALGALVQPAIPGLANRVTAEDAQGEIVRGFRVDYGHSGHHLTPAAVPPSWWRLP